MSIFVRLTFTAQLGNALLLWPACRASVETCGQCSEDEEEREDEFGLWLCCIPADPAQFLCESMHFSSHTEEEDCTTNMELKTKRTCYYTISVGQEAWCDLAGFSDRVCQGCVQRVSWVCNLICSSTGRGYAFVSLKSEAFNFLLPISQKSPHLLEATLGGSRPHGPPNTGGLQQGSLLLESQQGSKRTQQHGC